MTEHSTYEDLVATPIGEFEVESGTLRVSDPCYDIGSDGGFEIANAITGTWDARVIYSDEGSWGVRCAALICQVRDYPEITHEDYGWKDASEFYVDSGQAGVYDRKYYKCDSVMSGQDRIHDKVICDDEPWYSFNCDRTLSDASAGVIPYGSVSSSGFGDSVYKALIKLNEDDKVVAVLLDFFLKEKSDESRT